MKTILASALTSLACCAQSVTIVNSGSTNTAGFRIVVEQSGKAEYTSQPRGHSGGQAEAPKTISKTISASLAKSLYSDVNAALPLSSLPSPHCMKSASFGTRLTIEFGSDASPDLSCGDGGNEKMHALIHDATAIVNLFHSD